MKFPDQLLFICTKYNLFRIWDGSWNRFYLKQYYIVLRTVSVGGCITYYLEMVLLEAVLHNIWKRLCSSHCYIVFWTGSAWGSIPWYLEQFLSSAVYCVTCNRFCSRRYCIALGIVFAGDSVTYFEQLCSKLYSMVLRIVSARKLGTGSAY
jgi:hypothetical protein